MSWARPGLLWGAPLLLALISWAFRRYAGRRRRLAGWLGGREAALRLTGVALERFPWTRALLLAGATLAVLLALAEPRTPGLGETTPGEPWDVVLAIDVSRSMQATDVVPSRLGGAARALPAVMEALARHRVGLLLFAGRTYPLSPPATDKDAIRFFLGGIDPGLVNENDEGTSLAGALEGALALLEAREAPTGGRAIVIVSDGDSPAEDRGALLDAARGMARRGVRVFTIGVGSEQGAGLSRPNLAGRWGGPILASDGRPVVSRLERELLAGVASRGGGRYADASAPLEMRATVGALAALSEDGGPRAGRYAGLGPVFWLALVALLLLLPRGGGRSLRAPDESGGWPR